jgi:ribosomal protein L40E
LSDTLKTGTLGVLRRLGTPYNMGVNETNTHFRPLIQTNQMKQLFVKQVIEGCTAGLPAQIKYYTQFNQPVKIIDDTLAEVIGAIVNDTLCGGTGGGGWDACDGGEQKNSSHVQSKFCAKCGKKVSFFAVECPHCTSTSFKAKAKQKGTKKTNPRDGRWGISAKSHFKYLEHLNEYRLSLVEPLTDDPNCRQFRFTYWTLDKNSYHLSLYAKAQLDSKKSNHINFQPYGIDFCLSGCVEKFSGILTVHENHTEFDFEFFDLENTTPVEIPKKWAHLTSEEVIANKKFDKERGEWVRN